jgi:phosphate/sulfate permease
MTLVFAVVLAALVFEFINGFHDTANSIATVVSTKVLTPAPGGIVGGGDQSGRGAVGDGGGQDNRLGAGRYAYRHAADPGVRIVGCHHLEPDHVVVRFAFQLVARAGGWSLRRLGGWRIIRTLGHKLVKLQPVHGFAAETTSAAVIWVATALGIPVATTHNISAAIMGVGAAKNLKSLKWTVVERMVWAWILTLPVTGALAYGLVRVARQAGWF